MLKGIISYKCRVSFRCWVESGSLGTGVFSGGGPSVAFTEPMVPLVLTFLSGRAVMGPGVEQAAARKVRRVVRVSRRAALNMFLMSQVFRLSVFV